jgi:large subunit ribosomal protein L21
MMYAIIRLGGRHYRVAKDEVIDVDLLDQENGAKVEFRDVLFLADGDNVSFGTPLVANCLVRGELLEEVKGEKLTGMKYKRRKQERKTFGHRQRFSRVKITDIVSGPQKETHAEAKHRAAAAKHDAAEVKHRAAEVKHDAAEAQYRAEEAKYQETKAKPAAKPQEAKQKDAAPKERKPKSSSKEKG